MKKHYALSFLFLFSLLIIYSCSQSDEGDYVPVSPVTVNLADVPYPKLSDYKFFEGSMKNLQPSLDVLPFQPASALFSDYAQKKRFVWMPKGVKATFNGDGNVLELPVGAVLIKNFYYENVQNATPAGTTRIIETRLMIRKESGWIFADYVWNEEQTEAFYDLGGSYTEVSWKDENNVIKSTNYRIPAIEQCIVCHKIKEYVNENEITIHKPIGIKPQNLNFEINYGASVKNQLLKWIEKGYLEDGFSLPAPDNTVINYSDVSKPLALRTRSYVDANCSHCHQEGRHCDYRPMRFDFTHTGNAQGNTNMGVCVDTEDMQDFPTELNKIVAPGNPGHSMLYYRINTTNEAYRMPLHGRTIIHDEGVALMAAWINSLHDCE
ncbi:MAG: hypothetical protein EOO51_14065 [Flavobacterium sp.]|nr:MAG: hypothetical protein EOO51_14065 [Flavobacterium sp.]